MLFYKNLKLKLSCLISEPNYHPNGQTRRQRSTSGHEYRKLGWDSWTVDKRKGDNESNPRRHKTVQRDMESLYKQAFELCLKHLWGTCGLNPSISTHNQRHLLLPHLSLYHHSRMYGSICISSLSFL